MKLFRWIIYKWFWWYRLEIPKISKYN